MHLQDPAKTKTARQDTVEAVVATAGHATVRVQVALPIKVFEVRLVWLYTIQGQNQATQPDLRSGG